MIRHTLSTALKAAMIAQNKEKLTTVRLILAALKDRDIAERSKGITTGIEDAAILQMLQSMIKQRQDSIELYEKGGRPDLAAKEAQEITVIREFLPTQMTESETEAAFHSAAAEINATSVKEMGAVMTILKARYAGRMDFALAARLAKNILSA